MIRHRLTLAQFLAEERRLRPGAPVSFDGAILAVALVCKSLSGKVEYGALADVLGGVGSINVQGEAQQKLDVIAHETFVHCLQQCGNVRAMLSEEHDAPVFAQEGRDAEYLVAFDPLDGSSNIDVNVSVGSIFSVLRVPDGARPWCAEDFLQCGAQQVAAGYAIYGPSTMLVLSLGNGVHGFTLEPRIGEFLLTHRDLRVPRASREFAINASNHRFWDAPVQRYVDECVAGRSGPRGEDFNMRWIASLAADAHRILTRGGVFLYPRDSKDPARLGRLRLLYECNPIGFLIEQAGGRASTGSAPMLSVQPAALHERIGFVFGSRDEVERIERYHHESHEKGEPVDTPLFSRRGLFRDAA
ncbi:MAG: class 1 fructose-bisphosphatase [Burkholderiaceae bacterium]|jgi:fructose-1,6-bisphosphatase I/sedoheptulose-1,7-bisphosphatase|nr:class 1 fructose-bisphosphatase [Burkholderiaceae bacterium]